MNSSPQGATGQTTSSYSEVLEVTYRSPHSPWSDPGLLQKFLDTDHSQDTEDSWYLARWTSAAPTEGGLKILVSSPDRDSDPSFFHSLLGEIHKKLAHGFFLASEEKGWPMPRFSIHPQPHYTEESWTYSLELGPTRSDEIIIYPNKVLAVGEVAQLSSLLGLECQDPVFGLPAKWVTFSQAERAAQGGSLLFEATDVVMGHAINFLQTRMEYAVGLWELNQWLGRSLPDQGETLCSKLSDDLPLLLKLVRDLLKEGLHLPEPSRFCEHLQISRLSTSDDDLDELSLLLRKEVVNDNIPRWLDEQGFLNAVEWKSPGDIRTEDHHRMLGRLSEAIEEAHLKQRSGTAVLLVDAPARQELNNALSSIFPELPILAWSDLKDLSRIHILSSIDGDLAVDPSHLPTAFYRIPFKG